MRLLITRTYGSKYSRYEWEVFNNPGRYVSYGYTYTKWGALWRAGRTLRRYLKERKPSQVVVDKEINP
jgi:hypothetical protein